MHYLQIVMVGARITVTDSCSLFSVQDDVIAIGCQSNHWERGIAQLEPVRFQVEIRGNLFRKVTNGVGDRGRKARMKLVLCSQAADNIVRLKDQDTQASPELVTELQDHVKATIAPYKYPRVVEFVVELPKTATGKIQRFKLRDEGVS